MATIDNANGYSNPVRVYEVTLPAFVSITGEITLSGTKTGYTVANTATITDAATISASLDTSKRYIFGTEGNYQLATADNIGDYPDLTQVYKVTLPSGVDVTSKYAVGNDIYVAANAQVTLAATDDNKLLKSANLSVGTSNNLYTLDTSTKLGYLTDNFNVGEDYGGKYFKLTSGIGSDVKNIGDANKKFKGTATLGADVKVSFNGGATIEAVSGEISFNASNSTFNSLDSGDKFKIGTTEYTVGENCILQSGKVWLKPANVTLTTLSKENNWTATVDGTITLAATTETVNFYGADGKKVASFDGSTLTKANDSSTTITAITSSA